MPEKVLSQLKQNSVRELMEGEGDTYLQDLQADFTQLQSFFHRIHALTHTRAHVRAYSPARAFRVPSDLAGIICATQGILSIKASSHFWNTF